MNKREITIVTVNWYSTDFLVPLLRNLGDKAVLPENLSVLVVDNTNGEDKSLEQLNESPMNMQVLKHDSRDMKSSKAHAAALDYAMPHIQTPYCLIIDPDVYVFKQHWDEFCLAELKTNGSIAIGAPYPGWKLGKYHDFPSPVFCFFDTHKVRDLNTPWTPFGYSALYNVWICLIRQIARLGFLMTRRNYERIFLLQQYASAIEKAFGTFSQDTGWRIALAARRKKIRSIVFTVASNRDAVRVPSSARKAFGGLAGEYELYCFQDTVILTHKYGTGVRLWRTKRGADQAYWFECIRQMELSRNDS